MTTSRITRRAALKGLAAGIAAPFVFRAHGAAPSETVLHASFGANGMALSDIGSLTGSKNLKLVAVAEVDLARAAEVKKRFPEIRVTRLARTARQGKGVELGQHLDAGPHARADHHERHAARPARLHAEAVNADHLRGPPADEGGREKKLITQMASRFTRRPSIASWWPRSRPAPSAR